MISVKSTSQLPATVAHIFEDVQGAGIQIAAGHHRQLLATDSEEGDFNISPEGLDEMMFDAVKEHLDLDPVTLLEQLVSPLHCELIHIHNAVTAEDFYVLSSNSIDSVQSRLENMYFSETF